MIRETSRNAYHSIDLTRSQEVLMRWFHSQPNGAEFNRRQISQLSGIPINCVTPRTLELIAKGFLEEGEPRQDAVTGKRAHTVRIRPAQLELLAA